jgi:hypothetical protein
MGLVTGALAVIVTAAVGTLVLTGGSAAQVADEEFTVVSVLKRAHDIGRPPRPGSGEVLRWLLRNEARTSNVGSAVDHCVWEFQGRQYCESAYLISGRGRIIAEGTWNVRVKGPITLPVTGGTGDFLAVGGVANYTNIPGPGAPKVKITFILRR